MFILQSAELSCSAVGSPTPTVSWRLENRNNFMLTANPTMILGYKFVMTKGSRKKRSIFSGLATKKK